MATADADAGASPVEAGEPLGPARPEAADGLVRRRRPAGASPRRPWRRRLAWWIPLGLLMAVALVGGGTAWRIRDTFRTVNSASTPAASVSGAVLGGADGLVIDTGPAKTAVAAAAAGPTRTPTATATVPAAALPTEPAATATMATTSTSATSTSATSATATAATSAPATAAPSPEATLPTIAGEPSPTPGDGADPPPAGPTATPAPLDPTVTTVTTGAVDITAIVTPTPAEPAATQPPSAPAEPTPSATPSEPTATATPTEPAATAEPTATPAPVLSEVERIEDGGFEDGSDRWYVEDGAGPVVVDDAHGGASVMELPATGAFVDQTVFFIAGTTYRLSGWVRMTERGGGGELGIIFYDEAGGRLAEAEPKPIRFEATTFTEGTIDFTPPAGTAKVAVSLYNPGGGTATLQADDISVRSIVPPATVGASTAGPADDGSMTILFMGVDARPGEEIDINVRPDSLMLVHLNPVAKSCRVLSIPRDTRTDLAGYGETKINHALAVGGIDFQVQAVTALTGVPIDHYVLIDFNGFEDLVDAVGGITVDVPETYTVADGTVFPAGPQAMDGKRALVYARDRSGPDGDFGRIGRQQQIIRALVARASGLDLLTSIRELLPAVEQNVRTDLAATDMVSLGSTYRSICAEEEVTLLRLEGELATYDDPIIQLPLSYVIVDEAELRRKVAALLEP